jgi:hypothetical protein
MEATVRREPSECVLATAARAGAVVLCPGFKKPDDFPKIAEIRPGSLIF